MYKDGGWDQVTNAVCFRPVLVFFMLLSGYSAHPATGTVLGCTLREQIRIYLQSPESMKEVVFYDILESNPDMREARAGLSSRVGRERAAYVRLLGALQDVESAHAVINLCNDDEVGSGSQPFEH